ncbi:Helix-turn-helix domain-containing protein [Polaribacter sp. KT25b]|uniref:helix-turn-helix domain-containing protein n=1 Tax=Polaribacter sp. KT25b TaxID=1855336 RepID=UPI00087AFAAA|nr:helix-turn-helix domain-containing protein [Polaribacter sp. KT25b]SDR83444.1 Helix-turn-helix domain-containing protein [Polaribacter sp. KT25b]
MEFITLDSHTKNPLIDYFYQFKITEKDLPFETLILPVGSSNIAYNFCEEDILFTHKKNKSFYNKLTLIGQFYGSYEILINKVNYNVGFDLKPTSLYKIIDKDVSFVTNKQKQLKDFHFELYEKLNPLFLKYKDDITKLIESINNEFDQLTLSKDKNIEHIDKAIAIIIKNEGIIKVTDLLKEVPFSQKSLEIQFKKIIGVTPGKYIRQYRFMNLMRKYVSKQIEIRDLIFQSNYYDKSHFEKDFKLFMNQSSKKFFHEDYPLLRKILKES